MKELTLTKGMVALVDDDDYERVSQFKWYAHKGWKTYYGARRTSKDEGEKCVLLHRFIMGVTDSQQVDHRNSDGLNCQKYNLRVCSRGQNARNRDKQYNNTSGYKGVFWNKRLKKWQAKIAKEGRQYHIGFYVDKVQAAQMYDQKAIELHGEFALLNFPTQ